LAAAPITTADVEVEVHDRRQAAGFDIESASSRSPAGVPFGGVQLHADVVVVTQKQYCRLEHERLAGEIEAEISEPFEPGK
jgi:hypothetical protein